MVEARPSPAQLVGWGEVLEGLWKAAAGERLAHAILLRGVRGTGKYRALLRLAQGLLCEVGPAAPCEECGACKRLLSGNHPDLLVLDPTGSAEAGGPDAAARETIPIAWITPRKDAPDKDRPGGPSIEEFLALRPHEGGWKVVIVRECERLGDPAQNAFLKTLEEPRPRTLLALECSDPERLLPTVKSRLVSVQAPSLDDAAVREVLEGCGIEKGDLEEVVRLGRGSPGRALERAGRGAAPARALLDQLTAGTIDVATAGLQLIELAGEFPGRTPLARTRMRVRLILDLGLEALADHHRRASLAQRDEHAADLRQRLETWLQAREDVDANLAPEAALDRALLCLEGAAEA